MEKVFAILTESKKTKNIFKNQLNSYINKNKVKIKSYSLEEDVKRKINADLVITSKILKDNIYQYVKQGIDVKFAKRSLSISALNKLINIPKGKNVLFVNNAQITLEESLSFIEEAGINHINFIPYCPGMEVSQDFDLIVTPDEFEYIPFEVNKEEIINLGRRKISLITIIEILIIFDMLDENSNILIAKYIKKLVQLTKKFKEKSIQIRKHNEMLNSILNNVSDGIVYINSEKKLEFYNEEIKNIFCTENVATKIKKLNNEFSDKKSAQNLYKNINNKEVIINKEIIKIKDKLIGSILILKDVTKIKEYERILIRKTKSKGFIAQYNFSDISGKSEILEKTIEKAKHLAESDSTILIRGETGVGKEMFAQSIHNASKRKKSPFVAINCSALPSDLLESELFGYEEGAFTGAKKEGKEGIFEQAHRGTIFLDEISSLSFRVQSKLLRVLEEKEVRRISGTKIIPVDVRIIAATNQNLLKLIKESKFREDLYYRLNVLPLQIPSLRKRREDILPLIKEFFQYFNRGDIKLPYKILSRFYHYDWPGNVRELLNCVEYISQFVEGDTIKVEDLPCYIFENNLSERLADLQKYKRMLNKKGEINEYIFILKELYLAKQIGKNIGRRTIAQNAKTNNIDLSSQMIRGRINFLDKIGFVNVGKGRQGTKITEKGIKFLKKYNQ